MDQPAPSLFFRLLVVMFVLLVIHSQCRPGAAEGLLAAVSLAFFPTTTGLYILDISDAFLSSFGIILGAPVTVVVLAWSLCKLHY